jgi:hypothetical protein
MRLSHRRKRASKRGLYWPSRTKQARERREAKARAIVEFMEHGRKVSAMATAAANLGMALQQLGNVAKRKVEEIKSWLLPRDASHQKVSALCNGHTVTILVKTPQSDKI